MNIDFSPPGIHGLACKKGVFSIELSFQFWNVIDIFLWKWTHHVKADTSSHIIYQSYIFHNLIRHMCDIHVVNWEVSTCNIDDVMTCSMLVSWLKWHKPLLGQSMPRVLFVLYVPDFAADNGYTPWPLSVTKLFESGVHIHQLSQCPRSYVRGGGWLTLMYTVRDHYQLVAFFQTQYRAAPGTIICLIGFLFEPLRLRFNANLSCCHVVGIWSFCTKHFTKWLDMWDIIE